MRMRRGRFGRETQRGFKIVFVLTVVGLCGSVAGAGPQIYPLRPMLQSLRPMPQCG